MIMSFGQKVLVLPRLIRHQCKRRLRMGGIVSLRAGQFNLSERKQADAQKEVQTEDRDEPALHGGDILCGRDQVVA